MLHDVGRQIGDLVQPHLDKVRSRLLGTNNERLDFLMDSFYKLSAPQRSAVLAGLSAGLGLLLVGALGIYFARIATLEDRLSEGFESLTELRSLLSEHKQERENMRSLISGVNQKTASLKPKPFFERLGNNVGVKLEGLKNETVALAEDNPMSQDFKSQKIVFRMPKVSLPRLLKFLTEVEKADKVMSVSHLQIRARYGDRLYFDTQAQVTGYMTE